MILDVPDYVSVWNGYSPVPLKGLDMHLCQADTLWGRCLQLLCHLHLGFHPKHEKPEKVKTLEKWYFKCLDLRENLTAVGIHCSGMELPNAKFSAADKMGGTLLDHRHLAWVLPRCVFSSTTFKGLCTSLQLL